MRGASPSGWPSWRARTRSSRSRSTTRRPFAGSRGTSPPRSPTGVSCTSPPMGRDIRPIAIAHQDPAQVQMALDLQARYPVDPASPTGVPAVMRSGRPELYEHIDDEMLVHAAQDEGQLEVLRRVGMRSVIIAPAPCAREHVRLPDPGLRGDRLHLRSRRPPVRHGARPPRLVVDRHGSVLRAREAQLGTKRRAAAARLVPVSSSGPARRRRCRPGGRGQGDRRSGGAGGDAVGRRHGARGRRTARVPRGRDAAMGEVSGRCRAAAVQRRPRGPARRDGDARGPRPAVSHPEGRGDARRPRRRRACPCSCKITSSGA